MIGVLIILIVACVLYWCVQAILSATGIGDPVATIVKVLFVLLIVFWLLSQFGYGVPGLRLTR